MNNVQLSHFSSETLLQVSKLIDKRTRFIRTTLLPGDKDEELSNLLEFQTQVEYARQLVSKQETLTNN